MKKIILFLSGIFMFMTIGIAPAVAQSEKPMEIEFAQVWPELVEIDYQGHRLYYIKTQDPFSLRLYTKINVPVKVIYSLYVFKKAYIKSLGYDYMQFLSESNFYPTQTTQEDLDKNMDKIYEFPAITETKYEQKALQWDGYTDAKFTGTRQAVRACLYVVAHNADTGELIDTQLAFLPAENYRIASIPSPKYRIDSDKDGKKTISANVFLAYPDEWQITKLTVVLLTDHCLIGSITYNMINQGAEAMIANMARVAVAYKVLENPTVDPDNPYIKIFDWKDIKTTRQVKPTSETLEARDEAATKTQEERAKNVPKPEAYKNYEDFVSALREYFDTEDFIPDWDVWYLGFRLGFILETDEMTITGIKNGYITPGSYHIPDADDPVRWVFTGIETVPKPEGITIAQTPAGFRVDCENGVYANDLTIYDTAGRMVKKASLSGNTQSQEVSADLSSGIYFVKATGTNGNQPVSATLKFIK